MKITVVGLGKIGLPLAVQFAGRGHHVIGADVDERVLSAVRAARPPFPGEADLDRRLGEVVASGAFEATMDTAEAVAASDVVVVVVPLHVDGAGTPDFRVLDAATDSVGRGLRPGTLVSYETTLPVGTTRNRLGPRLEAASGLRAGTDFSLAFSPERVSSGRVFADLARYPKLVGGIDPASTRRATEFYAAVLRFDERTDLPEPNGVWDLDSAEAAELAKLAETTYRDVNIGLANQFALYADGIGVDFARIAAACNSQPFSHLHRPGIAVGGHCIPVYPWLYLGGDPSASIVRTAREANAAMPARCVEMLAERYAAVTGEDLAGAQVVVLGACYRGGVKETAFSGCSPPSRRSAGTVPCRWCRIRCTAQTSSPPWGSSPTSRVPGWRPPWCRPITPHTGNSEPPTCPASGSCSTGAGCSTPPAGRERPSSRSDGGTGPRRGAAQDEGVATSESCGGRDRGRRATARTLRCRRSRPGAD
ncbi:nucleotide sugar dehydrogenase [Pseudonocardia sp. T1-2H]|uniref:nucleotide sugar dehydrogenase n=1 Tax=Pseudonocardia sp. T1-2H TaxID=3128899 RepID=UPI0031012BEC